MAYPLIVFGAGASKDYIADADLDQGKLSYEPPLTKDLLSHRIQLLSTAITKNYPEYKPLIGEMNSALRAGKDFEEHLLELSGKGPNRKRQIIAFQYYLRNLFQMISAGYGGQTGNNYEILIGQLKESFDEACFVTFNYDTLLEQSLFPGENNSDIQQYVSGAYKLIKIHGSCDWSYSTPDDVSHEISGDIYQHLIKNPESAELISAHKVITKGNAGQELPAIAIPIAGKDESTFVCPSNHAEQLTEAVSKTDRILLVGWAARDPAFIRILKENISRPVDLFIVCTHLTNVIDAIQQKFDDIEFITVKEIQGDALTFSKFMNSPGCDEFMRR